MQFPLFYVEFDNKLKGHHHGWEHREIIQLYPKCRCHLFDVFYRYRWCWLYSNDIMMHLQEWSSVVKLQKNLILLNCQATVHKTKYLDYPSTTCDVGSCCSICFCMLQWTGTAGSWHLTRVDRSRFYSDMDELLPSSRRLESPVGNHNATMLSVGGD